MWLQYHHFWLAEARDALYNAAGVAYRRDPTGQSGTDVGNEIDFILNFHLTDTLGHPVGVLQVVGRGVPGRHVRARIGRRTLTSCTSCTS